MKKKQIQKLSTSIKSHNLLKQKKYFNTILPGMNVNLIGTLEGRKLNIYMGIPSTFLNNWVK